MFRKRNTLNNMSIETHRKSPLYQAIVTDLCLEGAISRDKAEKILGYEIPDYMKGPAGGTLKAKQAAAKDKKAESPAPSAEAVKEE